MTVRYPKTTMSGLPPPDPSDQGFSMMHTFTRFAARTLLISTLLAVFCALPDAAAQDANTTNTTVDPALFSDMEYRMVGPARGGRVTAVAGHPAHPHAFYMGSTGGGVWKTTDAGITWRSVSDGHGFKSLSMGALHVAPSDTNVVYAGTGSDGIRSNVIAGKGMYKSTDAGASWTAIGLEAAGQIGNLAVHPTDPNRVYAAALGSPFGRNEQRGVFRSTDGGATWEKVLFVSDSTGAYGLSMNPENPDVLYASLWRGERKPWTIISGCADPCQAGIYKTTDGGDTWTQVLAAADMPDGLIGKIDVSVSPANPDRIYALVEARPEAEGLYRSDDAGATWTLVNDRPQLMGRPFYYTNVHAHPTDPDVVYVNGNVGEFSRSDDAGASFKRIRTPHVDNHDMWINPDNPDIMIQSNDGGANVTLDGGQTWSTQHNQPTAELYQVDVDDQFPYWLYAGQQDNSTIAVPSLPPAERAPAGPEGWWTALGGCETGPVVPKPGNPDVVYGNCKGRFDRYNRTTGQAKRYYVGAEYMYGRNPAELAYRFQRTVPIEVSPHDPDVVYHGSQYVHRTTDDGRTWETISPDLTAFKPDFQVVSGRPITRDITGEEHFSTLYEIEVSPHSPEVIWTGANDGPVHVTRDGGQTWTDVTPPDMPSEGRIDGIEPSPHQPGKAYIAGHRYLLNDWRPYIYRTTDYGRTWTLLTPGGNGIPADHPTRVVREDPDREGLLYAGTEHGVFVSFDDGAHWQPLQQNLPPAVITDIEVHRKDLVLSTMGRGFWILDNLTPLHQARAEVADAEAHLFQPRDAHRMRYRARAGDGPHAPEYLPPGAIIDFYLAEAPSDEVVLEVMDSSGTVVSAFSSLADDQSRTPEPYNRMDAPTPVAEAVGGLEAQAGMNRFIWNLRHPGAWDDDGRSSYGPLATPGNYQVRLTVGDWSMSRSLRLHIDPRVAADGVTVADLEAQLQLNLQIRDAISAARRIAHDMASYREQLQAAMESDERSADEVRPLIDEIERLHAQLVTSDEDSYPPPMLIDQMQYLYGMTTRADQQPGQDAFDRFETLRGDLNTILDDWRSTLRGYPNWLSGTGG